MVAESVWQQLVKVRWRGGKEEMEGGIGEAIYRDSRL